MRAFFSNPFKVSLTALILTILVTVSHFGVLSFAGTDSELLYNFGKVFIAVALPVLITVPILGFIYSFFIQSKIKVAFILFHLASICTISLFAFVAFMFRYFVPFAP